MKNFPIFVAGFMLGALCIGALRSSSDFFLVPPPSSASSTQVQSVPESGAVSITNQPAGTTVLVESVTVPQPGVWVAVREMSGTTLGNVLGAVRVSGPRSAVTVQLLRATEPNLSYAVELYRDDNNGKFDPATNSVYIDFATGAPVIAYFSTTN